MNFLKEPIMAFVRVEQRNAHLAGSVKLEYVNGREGKVAKGLVTAISNSRRGPAESREDEATAIQWTLWGKQAENAAEYLGKGSYVNIVGRLRNNNYEKDGARFTAWPSPARRSTTWTARPMRRRGAAVRAMVSRAGRAAAPVTEKAMADRTLTSSKRRRARATRWPGSKCLSGRFDAAAPQAVAPDA